MSWIMDFIIGQKVEHHSQQNSRGQESSDYVVCGLLRYTVGQRRQRLNETCGEYFSEDATGGSYTGHDLIRPAFVQNSVSAEVERE